MSYRQKSETVIGYINRHVPKVTWDDLSEEDCNHFLAMIRRYSREFYTGKSVNEVYTPSPYMPSLREMMDLIRISRYDSGFLPREMIIDELDLSWHGRGRSLPYSGEPVTIVETPKIDARKTIHSMKRK